MKPYPSYKDSGVEWIGQIPSHWDSLKLGRVLDAIESGKREQGGGNNLEDGILSLGGEHILEDGKLSISNPRFISEEFYDEMNSGQVKNDDLLIVKDGATIGKSTHIQRLPLDRVSVNEHVFVLRGKSIIENRFLFYISRTRGFVDDIWNTVKTSVIPGLISGFKNVVNITFPPLPEQQQIVSFLDHKTRKIDELIEKTNRKIELLKEKRTSLVNHCVTKGLNPNVEMKYSGVEWIGEIPIGWSMRKGSTIGLYSKGSGISKDKVKDSGIPCIRYGEIYTIYDRVVFSTKSFISEKSTDNCVRVSKGSVLLTGSGETVEDIGKCVVYMGESDIYIGGDIIIIDLVGEIQPLFMSYLMNSECIRIQKSLLGRGEIIVHIYPKNIREIQYPIPPLPEQKQIVEYVDEQTQKIDTTVEKETQRIELLKEYRQSLISEVVTGKIDVREEMVV